MYKKQVITVWLKKYNILWQRKTSQLTAKTIVIENILGITISKNITNYNIAIVGIIGQNRYNLIPLII